MPQPRPRRASLLRPAMYALLALALVCSLFPGAGRAAAGNAAGFAPVPILPESQVEGTNGFYDLALSPGQEEELTLRLVNDTGAPLTLTVEAVSASTDAQGEASYAVHSDPEGDFERLTTGLPLTLTLEPLERREVSFSLRMPERGLLGAVVVRRAQAQGAEAPGLTHTFAYTIAVRLNAAEAAQ